MSYRTLASNDEIETRCDLDNPRAIVWMRLRMFDDSAWQPTPIQRREFDRAEDALPRVMAWLHTQKT